MKKSGAEIMECLVREGGSRFGHPGGAIAPAPRCHVDYPIHHALVRQAGAAHVADGYARVTGKRASPSPRRGRALQTRHGHCHGMMDSTFIVCITGRLPPTHGGDATGRRTTGITCRSLHNFW